VDSRRAVASRAAPHGTSGTADERGGPVVPVLLYHAVTATPGSQIAPYAVPPDEFARHMDAVVAAGCTAVSFGNLVSGSIPSARRPVVVTFDDGYADFAEFALPVLLERSLPATMFVTTGWMAGGASREPGPIDPMLSWSQLPELLAGGIELGAHSHSHPQMDTLTAAGLRAELGRPKEMLEDALGRPVDLFAYPHGYNGPRVRRAVRIAGFRAAAAVRNALHTPGEDPFAISRLTVGRTTTAQDVSRWLDGADAPVAGSGEALTTKGWRAYRRGKAFLRGQPGSDYR
jgi:peptidoglycan/xylan/chitin deacetylase (PgdA/CDA1 family)